MTKPVVATTKIDVVGVRGKCTMRVFAGLNFIAGNAAPHFSITSEVTHGRRDLGGGANHEEILKHFPQFADIAALHLSEIDGMPMQAVSNGWYWLCGATDTGNGERYHGGNSGTPKNQDACLKAFANHVRIDLETAATLRDDLFEKTDLIVWIETQRPRYKAEADACIAKHGLIVFGDAWNPDAA